MRNKNTQSIYNKINWDIWLKSLPKEFHALYNQEIIFVNSAMKKGDALLDVGFGSGRLIRNIKIPTDAKIIGIDKDQAIFERYFMGLKNIPNVFLVYSNAKNMPFFQSTFDVACVAGGGFCNFLEDKKAIVAELFRVLRPGGSLLFSAFHENSINIRSKVYNASKFDIKINKNGTFTSFDKHTHLPLESSESLSIDKILKLFQRWPAPPRILWSNEIAHIYQVKK